MVWPGCRVGSPLHDAVLGFSMVEFVVGKRQMAEILGIGVSHYPPFSGTDENMADIFRYRLKDPALPPHLLDPENWPDGLREEMGNDGGAAAAAQHREQLLCGMRKCMDAIRDFDPDFCIIWGDDQYENFREDIIPPFCVFAYDDMKVYPWGQIQESGDMTGKPNYWNEPKEFGLDIRYAKDFAKELTKELIEAEFDMSYAYKPLHHPGVAHAFLNALLYLDYDRKGFPYPIIPMQINCYGSRVISYRGYLSSLADVERPLDPPSPTPRRCFSMGAEVARICAESPYRVALIASSSWSHAFLNDKSYRMVPDTEFDRKMYAALAAGDYETWRNLTLDDITSSGNQEMLNWATLLGAMNALDKKPAWTDFVETQLFNSNKVAAIF